MSLSNLKTVVAPLLGVGALALAVGGPLAQGNRPQGEAERRVVLLRVPNGGIQPQVAVDAKGGVHLLYFKGDPGGGDLFYARSRDGMHFGDPLRVNSQP